MGATLQNNRGRDHRSVHALTVDTRETVKDLDPRVFVVRRITIDQTQNEWETSAEDRCRICRTVPSKG
jgi:hypothetical protein